MIDYKDLSADTLRFEKKGAQITPMCPSPNCGLLCYLCEATLNSNENEVWMKPEIAGSIDKLLGEAQIYRGRRFWGWEKQSTVKNVYFPLDWDDTSKAIDFLSLASRQGFVSSEALQLPDDNLWESELRKSFFYSAAIGEDVRIDYIKSLALSVFFGPHSRKWKERDDPMVTLTLIRTTKLWFPRAYESLEMDLVELIDKLIFTAVHAIKNRIPFMYISRYYFSFSHFVYRLVELLDLVSIQLPDTLIFEIEQKVDVLSAITFGNASDIGLRYDDLFWVLVGVKTNLIDSQEHFKSLKLARIEDEGFIFRHRRLNHFYLAINWYEKMFYWELQGRKFENITLHSNELNFPETAFATSKMETTLRGIK